MPDRHQSRILALQALCQLEVIHADFLPQLDAFLADESPPKRVQSYARGLVLDADAHKETIDDVLQRTADNWELKRMAPVDRNTLRVAVCELLYRPDVPPKVVLNEAIEIGKAFGTAESPGFINGVLDAIVKHRREATAGVEGV